MHARTPTFPRAEDGAAPAERKIALRQAPGNAARLRLHALRRRVLRKTCHGRNSFSARLAAPRELRPLAGVASRH